MRAQGTLRFASVRTTIAATSRSSRESALSPSTATSAARKDPSEANWAAFFFSSSSSFFEARATVTYADCAAGGVAFSGGFFPPGGGGS